MWGWLLSSFIGTYWHNAESLLLGVLPWLECCGTRVRASRPIAAYVLCRWWRGFASGNLLLIWWRPDRRRGRRAKVLPGADVGEEPSTGLAPEAPAEQVRTPLSQCRPRLGGNKEHHPSPELLGNLE